MNNFKLRKEGNDEINETEKVVGFYKRLKTVKNIVGNFPKGTQARNKQKKEVTSYVIDFQVHIQTFEASEESWVQDRNLCICPLETCYRGCYQLPAGMELTPN